MPRIVLDMADRRPIWAMPEWVPERIRASLPEGWEVVIPAVESDGSGDGIMRAAPEMLDAVREAEVYFGWGIAEALLEAGQGLRWVHSAVAGVGKSLTPRMVESPVVFTNSAGIHAEPVAEAVVAMILHFGRGLDFAIAAQRRREWWKQPYYEADTPLFEMPEVTIGILGFGGIGREVARRVAALGSSVLALKRKPPAPADAELEPVGGGGSLASRIQVLAGADGLDRLLAESDVLVVTAPETAETRGLVDAGALARMREGALLVNVARGSIVDETALLDALRSGRLRGAGLDVFWKEPPPEDHPLWEMPNVLMSPHVAPVTHGFWRREAGLILRNLERYLQGAPLERWENVVDKRAGY
jgi:phosphoglycerate dehydrogenase-like enzyme